MLSVLHPPPRRHASAILVLIGVWAVSGPACPKALGATGPPAWSAIPLPGDRIQLCRIAGLDARTDAARLPFELVRVLYSTAATAPRPNQKTFAGVLDYLRRAADVPGERRERVPLPLAAAVWRDVVLPAVDARASSGYQPPEWLSPELARAVVTRGRLAVDDDHLLAVILSNRSAALMYYGLAALDADALAYVSSHPRLLGWIATERPGTFAACAGALGLVGDVVQLPGGEDAKPLWSAIVGQEPSNAEKFITALLARDSGRLAYFFDSLAALDRPHLRFALGGPAPDSKARVARFRQLYAAFSCVDSDWSLENGPFSRRADDGRLLLSLLAVTSEGQLAPPASVGLWSAVFQHDGSTHAGDDRPADAATIARYVLDRDASTRRQNVRAVLFAQRVFGMASDSDGRNVAVAVRSYRRFEALHLTLERLGMTEPAFFVKAADRAAVVAGLPDETRRAVTTGSGSDAQGARPPGPRMKAVLLSQFQGALALIDRFAWRGVLDVSATHDLVGTLVTLPIDEKAGYGGGVGRWITSDLLPQVRAGLRGSAAEDAEDLVLEGLAGLLPPGSSTLPTVRWEDHDYRIDPAAGELNRLLIVREKQGGNRLGDVLALVEQLTRLREGTADAQRLLALSKTLRVPELRSVSAAAWTPDVIESMLAEASQVASSSRDGKPELDAPLPAFADGLAARLSPLADEMLGSVLRALTYAAHIGDPENNILLGPSLADDHDFGLGEPNITPIAPGWSLPTERGGLGAPWHVGGALLCLDTVLGRFSLPRTMSAPIGPRRLGRRDEQMLAHTAVLARPADLLDTERDRLTNAIARGRQLAAAATDPEAMLALGEAAGIDPRRRHTLAWAVGSASARPAEMLTLAELLRIGAGTGAVTVDAAWGASSLGLDGCPCLRFRAGEPMDGYGWLPTTAVSAAATPDLTLRLAEITARLGVPAAVAALVLPDATQELLETAHAAYPDDWFALAAAASAITESRRVEKIANLTAAGGPLIPRGSAVKHD